MGLDALCPRVERRARGKGLVLDEDVVKALVVLGRSAEYRVLEERECKHVCGSELAEEIVAPIEQILEERDRAAHPYGELDDTCSVGARLLLFGGDQVRRPLPDVVEPLDEDAHLCAARRVARKKRRIGNAPLEPLDDRRRVADDLDAVDEYRDERLAADVLDGRAVVRIDVDPLDGDGLVPGSERDPLDIRRERNPVDADQIQFFRLKNQSWPIVVARITPHENA